MRSKEFCVVEEDVFELAKRFLDRLTRTLIELRTAAGDRDFEQIRKTGHDLKGSGGAYGLDAFSQLGTQLERAAHAADAQRVGQLLTRLENKLLKVELKVEKPAHTEQ